MQMGLKSVDTTKTQCTEEERRDAGGREGGR